MKILIVDDDDFNRKILQTVIDDAELEWLEAENGQEALDMVEQHSEIRIILLDRMMPVMNGMEFMEEYKKRADSEERAVIMQSAANQPQDIIAGKTAGAYYYLAKPYSEDVALSVIRAAMDDLRDRGIV